MGAPERVSQILPPRLRYTIQNTTLTLLCRLEFDGEVGLHRYWTAIHRVRLEPPLLHAVNGRAGKGKRTLDEFGVLDSSVPAYKNLQDDRALLSANVGWIVQRRLIG